MHLPELSLYIHVPWCVQKCPYCDFNSHGQKGTIPEQEYVSHLIDDFKADLPYVQGRDIRSIFIGGGTPSLLSEQAIGRLLAELQQYVQFSPDIEITLEANPGTLEYNKFAGFAQGGVNRISIGVQSFETEKLVALGRIHSPGEAKTAAAYAAESVSRFNIDLMHGLPKQTTEQALADVKQAIALNPTHLSWYQLTIEPNTQFHSKPPVLPQDETLWQIQQLGHDLLTAAGYQQYEISAYAKPDQRCYHNLNYWRFGDYIGIGCGAHGKITLANEGRILRTEKVKHPKGYMDLTKPYLYKHWQVEQEDLPFEYFMNRLRLKESFSLMDFERATGLPQSRVTEQIQRAIDLQLLQQDQGQQLRTTAKGTAFYNNLVDLFL